MLRKGIPRLLLSRAGRSSPVYSVAPLLRFLGSAPVMKSSPTPSKDSIAGNYGCQFRFQIDLRLSPSSCGTSDKGLDLPKPQFFSSENRNNPKLVYSISISLALTRSQ